MRILAPFKLASIAIMLFALFALNACKDDELVVATAANFAPFEYIEGQEFKGIDMDIAKTIAQKLGKN
ncbi:transporter substrate-binding domain-containing protein [uncultured Helicobacter sp.]|uniref:transporter substrate-binding domain-containing protein n=2 Tax=uncultured Helicobacter sp. TaxID=175537 RepID=UPI0025FCF72C|nr:transporter substrate-binding domain-containing protein [uncultured Helicobacter sp.]